MDERPEIRKTPGPLAREGRAVPTNYESEPDTQEGKKELLRSQQKAEIEKWWPIITAANIKAE